MRLGRRELLAGGAALLAATGSTRAGAAQLRAHRLFVIERSKNANVVVYDALTDGHGLNPRRPLDAYWLLHAEAGQRDELSWLEKKLAYGHELQSKVTRDGFDMRLVSFERTLRVRLDGGRPFAWTQVAGRRARLQRVFVQTDEGGVRPSVQWVDVHGLDLKTRSPLSERLQP